ncbi:U3 small nucleolar RNA-associated protein 13 [Nematocida minor]|uniref:U3 small nucleolar RNA-associated protein 13 n=1 Tax=Nematocida minor TaxID=1912983 RepID=UPI002220D3CF|nr:U3 small nucleolar RNA-associated protein 13 [Nematocida minor]KAI5192205.1 U3 small nucleolar RNA-associated protein 13 [Nematocida minor]
MEAIQETLRIEPIFNTLGACLINSRVYTGYNSTLFGTNIHTSKIEVSKEVESEIVKIFAVYDRVLVSTVTGHVYLYSTEENTLESIMKNTIVKTADVNGNILVIGDAEGSVIGMDISTHEIIMRKKIDGMAVAVKSVEMRTAKKMYKMSSHLVVAGDALGTVTIFDINGNVIYKEKNAHSGHVTFICEIDGVVVTAGMDGLLVQHRIGEEALIKEVGESVLSGTVYNDSIVLAVEGSLLFLSLDLKKISKTPVDIPNIVNIGMVQDVCLITTEESDIVLGSVLDGRLLLDKIIVGNNDEITDMLIIDNTVIVGTNSRYIRSMRTNRWHESDGMETYACSGSLIKAQNEECILSMCGNGKVFYTGSKDGYISKYEVRAESVHSTVELVETVKIEEAITVMCAHQDILITGTEGGIVHGWKISEKLSLVFTSAVSSSEITGIVVQNKKIHCTSKDKEIKIITISGNKDSVISGHKKGIWSLSTYKEVLLTGSTDKTARIWKSDTNSVLQHNASVVKTLLTERAVTATSDGVVRIWNVANYKELAAHRVTEMKDERIWAMKQYRENEYIVSAGPRIVVLKDNTWELEKKKEETQKEEYISKQKASIFMKKGDFVSAAVEYYRLGLERELKSAMRKIEVADTISPFMEVIMLEPAKFIKSVSKWARSPQLFTIAQRILRDALSREWTLPRKDAEDLSKTLQRTAETFNSAY